VIWSCALNALLETDVASVDLDADQLRDHELLQQPSGSSAVDVPVTVVMSVPAACFRDEVCLAGDDVSVHRSRDGARRVSKPPASGRHDCDDDTAATIASGGSGWRGAR